jgi:hypothetical protein
MVSDACLSRTAIRSLLIQYSHIPQAEAGIFPFFHSFICSFFLYDLSKPASIVSFAILLNAVKVPELLKTKNSH